MRIVVTGGCGFLGSHLCDLLSKNGHIVDCIDNLCTGNLNNHKYEINDHSRMNVCSIDENISKYFESPEQIYHLACKASPVAYRKDPIGTIETSILGTQNILEWAKKTGARVLYASSSEVYGEPLEHPQKESLRTHVNSVGPRACYDLGKALAETLCWEYAKKYKLDIRIARIHNTYGPRMDPNDGRIVSTFIRQSLANKPLTIFGNGSQTRSLCYVSDMVHGLVKLMNIPRSSTLPEPVNLGGTKETTILEIAELISNITRKNPSNIEFLPLPQDEPTRRCPDVSKAKKLINWEQKVSLRDGLNKTLFWMQRALY